MRSTAKSRILGLRDTYGFGYAFLNLGWSSRSNRDLSELTNVVPLAGFEPASSGLADWRSIRSELQGQGRTKGRLVLGRKTQTDRPFAFVVICLQPNCTRGGHVCQTESSCNFVTGSCIVLNVARKKLPPEIRSFFVSMGSKGGKIGGKALAAKLTPEQRSENARRAVRARWAKAKKGK